MYSQAVTHPSTFVGVCKKVKGQKKPGKTFSLCGLVDKALVS